MNDVILVCLLISNMPHPNGEKGIRMPRRLTTKDDEADEPYADSDNSSRFPSAMAIHDKPEFFNRARMRGCESAISVPFHGTPTLLQSAGPGREPARATSFFLSLRVLKQNDACVGPALRQAQAHVRLASEDPSQKKQSRYASRSFGFLSMSFFAVLLY